MPHDYKSVAAQRQRKWQNSLAIQSLISQVLNEPPLADDPETPDLSIGLSSSDELDLCGDTDRLLALDDTCTNDWGDNAPVPFSPPITTPRADSLLDDLLVPTDLERSLSVGEDGFSDDDGVTSNPISQHSMLPEASPSASLQTMQDWRPHPRSKRRRLVPIDTLYASGSVFPVSHLKLG